jgi:quercetin dioxygenase-like cupin family protein
LQVFVHLSRAVASGLCSQETKSEFATVQDMAGAPMDNRHVDQLGDLNMLRPILYLCAGALLSSLGLAQAQQQSPATQSPTPTIKRTPLQKFDVPGADYETIIGLAEIAPDVVVGRHTHPGPESGYVIEGQLILMIKGKDDVRVNTGESYLVPAGTIHDAKAGPMGAKVVATYIVQKGKPLASADD